MNKSSRSTKAIWNTSSELGYQLVSVICGLILPRLILSQFGSTYNGITHSITQFISCVELLKSGIGSVTRAALYKPLAYGNYNEISGIVNATQHFMRRIALIFFVFIAVLSIVYPFLVTNDISWLSCFFLVLILSISTFVQYFFGITYQMLIQADQANYIISLTQIGVTCLNTAICALLIYLGGNIHIVKFGSALVYIIPPLVYAFYASRKYHIDTKVLPRTDLISQRWDAFGHQVANFINSNTDIIVTTIILGVKEVSVYTIYNLVGYSIKKVITAVAQGVAGAFGNMIAKREDKVLKDRFQQYELLMYFISTTLFITTAMLFLPFVKIYTSGVEDVNYIRPLLAILVCVANYFACMKLPYETLVFASGLFRDTKKAAYLEALINICLSIALAFVVGLNGIIIGTIAAGLYRMLVYNNYAARKILHISEYSVFIKLLYTGICVFACYYIFHMFYLPNINNFGEWIVYAILEIIVNTIVCFCVLTVLYRGRAVDAIKYVIKIVRRKK